ncbi:MAG: hypothetical protein JSV03_09825 [Planctomycetota bacterium]|nr:MAG: hypothetical protein JSV03_09825 [Planctomycetota bacterium]
MIYRYAGLSIRQSIMLALAGLGLALNAGCGVLNPALVGLAGGNPIAGLESPEGYVAVLLMNNSAASVEIQLDVTREGGILKDWSLTTGPADYYVMTLDCDIETISFVTFSYTDVGGTVDIPTNLGSLVMGDSLECGRIIVIQATGTPPTFSVQVW